MAVTSNRVDRPGRIVGEGGGGGGGGAAAGWLQQDDDDETKGEIEVVSSWISEIDEKEELPRPDKRGEKKEKGWGGSRGDRLAAAEGRT